MDDVPNIIESAGDLAFVQALGLGLRLAVHWGVIPQAVTLTNFRFEQNVMVEEGIIMPSECMGLVGCTFQFNDLNVLDTIIQLVRDWHNNDA